MQGWAPAIVALASCLITVGAWWARLASHEKRLDEHDDLHESHREHLARVDIALVRLEEYNRGFADAAKLSSGKNIHPHA